MVPGLLITSVVTAVMSAALFTRRSRTGWLDELADIRGGALSEPDGEVDRAMADGQGGDAGSDDDRHRRDQHGPDTSAGDWGAPAPTGSPSTPDEPATPAPHPLRPHEVWHAHAGLGDGHRERPGVEERIAGEDIQDDRDEPGDTVPRFRFARLRPVGDDLHREASAPAAGATGGTTEAPAAAGFGDLFLHDHPSADTVGAADPGAAPLVPLTVERSTNGLIDGPVRRGRRRGRRTGIEAPTDPWQALGLDGPEQAGAELDPGRDTTATGEAATAPHLAASDAVADEPADCVPTPTDAAAGADTPAEPASSVDDPTDPVSNDAPATEAAPATVAAEPSAPVPVDLGAGPDGVLATAGTIRLDLGGQAEATRSADGTVSVDVGRGWCWTVAADPVCVTTPGGSLSVPPATTALSVVESDGSTFLVVIDGEAVLVRPGGRLRLRAGAMVLTPPDGEPQVDVASEAEIAGDPLVARNRALDAAG